MAFGIAPILPVPAPVFGIAGSLLPFGIIPDALPLEFDPTTFLLHQPPLILDLVPVRLLFEIPAARLGPAALAFLNPLPAFRQPLAPFFAAATPLGTSKDSLLFGFGPLPVPIVNSTLTVRFVEEVVHPASVDPVLQFALLLIPAHLATAPIRLRGCPLRILPGPSRRLVVVAIAGLLDDLSRLLCSRGIPAIPCISGRDSSQEHPSQQ